jgi:hypothetical protein
MRCLTPGDASSCRWLQYADAPAEIVDSLTTLQLIGPDAKKDIEVKQFLGRMLGLSLVEQNWLFEKFSGALEGLIAEAKQAGKYIQGIVKISGRSVMLAKPPTVLCTDAQSRTSI